VGILHLPMRTIYYAQLILLIVMNVTIFSASYNDKNPHCALLSVLMSLLFVYVQKE
jgi:uncharacterized membrane protein